MSTEEQKTTPEKKAVDDDKEMVRMSKFTPFS